ncbi:MAG: type II toxin-antitoxin system RelE/ParE family toxin [Pseudomonadota bacterium]
MTRLIFAPLATRDIDGIWDYTAGRWGIDQAEQYAGDIRTACSALLQNPDIGQDAGAVRTGYRKQRSGSHFIFYRQISGGGIEIIRVLHQQMDFGSHL